MTKLSVNETKWSSLLGRARALILNISISIFDFGPVKLPGLSRNGPLGRTIISEVESCISLLYWIDFRVGTKALRFSVNTA